MNQEQCLKQNILHIRSITAVRGFEWQKRMFKLYHDRIVYLSTDSSAIELGSIPLCCITSITDFDEEKKNRFDIVLGNYRMYQLLSITTNIAKDWVQILRSSILKYSIRDRITRILSEKGSFWRTSFSNDVPNNGGYIHNNFCEYNDESDESDDIGYQSDPGIDSNDLLPPQSTTLTTSKSSITHPKSNRLSVAKGNKRHKRGAQSNNFFNNHNEKEKSKEKGSLGVARLSVMKRSLPSSIDKYRVIESFSYGVFGAVGIVQYNDDPYLLCICNKTSSNYQIALSVMERMTDLINPYIITQLQRGKTSSISFASYNLPTHSNLQHILNLFGNISLNSVRILIAEVICGLEYLHSNNFNFPNLNPNTIFISHCDHIVLTDFGFAIPNNRKNAIYRSGPLCYAPPEFLLNAVDDIKSDWWRLGVLLYHLIVGKPPFTGNKQDITHKICHSHIDDDMLWNRNRNYKQNQQYIFVKQNDDLVKDLISLLLTRERKDRLGCSVPLKKKNKRSHKHHKYGCNNIMNHSFFDCITKKNKHYPFNWNQIRKRKHKPAPILSHIADRYVYPIQSISDFANKHHEQHELSYINDHEGSIIDTTDDEEFIVSDDEYEEKYMYNAQSQSNSKTTPPDEHYLNDAQNNSMSTEYGISTSPDAQSPFTNPFHSTLTPLPQSGSSQVHISNASATPPPSSSNISFINTTAMHSAPTQRSAMTPLSAAFRAKQQKSKPKVLPIHRKRLSSRLTTPPIKALPPPPASKTPPMLNQSLIGQEYASNEPAGGSYDHRFSNYVKHQQSQMSMDHNISTVTYHPPPPPRTGKYGGISSPTLSNLPGYHSANTKRDDDTSTVFSDQIAAAAALRRPILSSKQREKQKKKTKKKNKNVDDDDIHVRQKKTLPQIETGKRPPKHGLNNLIKAKADDLFNKKIRAKVSKKKRRFVDKVHGFNLDLTYITKRIIAMGFPSSGKERVYRNPTDEVKRFFNTYHCRKFKVYNLCIEKDRQYPDSKFSDIGGCVARYGFKDHNSPDLELILRFCIDLDEWFSRDKANVAAIHCKAGKGRTGVMICSYLAFAKICRDATDALKKYGMARTKNAKGVTIPSQRRWVLYFIDYVMNPKISLTPIQFSFYRVVILKRVQMNTIPDFDIGGGCDPYFRILNTKNEVLYDYSEYHQVKAYKSTKKRKLKKKKEFSSDIIKFECLDIVLRGAFKIVFYDKDVLSKDDVMCWCWLHSAISSKEKYIKLERENIDGAVKDKSFKYFDAEFSLEFWFKDYQENKEENATLNDWICENMDPRNIIFMKVKNRERRGQNIEKTPYKVSRNTLIEYTLPRSKTADYNHSHSKSKSNIVKPRLMKRSSANVPHLAPWKKKLNLKFEKRHSASNIMNHNESEKKKKNKKHRKKGYAVSRNTLIEYKSAPKGRHKSKSNSEYKVSRNYLIEYKYKKIPQATHTNSPPIITRHQHNSAPESITYSHPLTSIGEHEHINGLDFTGVDYGNINMEYSINDISRHYQHQQQQPQPHPSFKRIHSNPNRHMNKHQQRKKKINKTLNESDINKMRSNPTKRHRNPRPRLQLNNNYSNPNHSTHNRNLSANNADNYHKQNNYNQTQNVHQYNPYNQYNEHNNHNKHRNRFESTPNEFEYNNSPKKHPHNEYKKNHRHKQQQHQYPPSFQPPAITNTQMMTTLRHNMQHHINDNNNGDSNRKTTIV